MVFLNLEVVKLTALVDLLIGVVWISFHFFVLKLGCLGLNELVMNY